MQRTLKDRFRDAWRHAGAFGGAEEVFAELEKRYAVSPRAYHTMDHVAFCLNELSSLPHGMCTNMVAIEIALWFHDACETEQASADFFAECARTYGIPEWFIQKVCDMILATTHRSVPVDEDTMIVVDIDLAILGQHEEVFDRYDARIRLEYLHLDSKTYREGRTIVLRNFLSRGEAIYCTQAFRDRYGAQALENLQRAIDRLAT